MEIEEGSGVFVMDGNWTKRADDPYQPCQTYKRSQGCWAPHVRQGNRRAVLQYRPRAKNRHRAILSLPPGLLRLYLAKKQRISQVSMIFGWKTCFSQI